MNTPWVFLFVRCKYQLRFVNKILLKLPGIRALFYFLFVQLLRDIFPLHLTITVSYATIIIFHCYSNYPFLLLRSQKDIGFRLLEAFLT